MCGGWGHYYLKPNEQLKHECISYNSGDVLNIQTRFDSSFAPGEQILTYDLPAAAYHFVRKTLQTIDLNTGAIPTGLNLNAPKAAQTVSDCSTEKASPPGARPATFLLMKNVQKTNLDIFWVNTQGNRIKYKTLQPHEIYKQPTFVGHIWVAAYSNGQCHKVLRGPASTTGHGQQVMEQDL